MRFQSGVLAATEAMIGLVYDANDTNLYRLELAGHIEFLDVEKESISANLVQPVRDLFDYFYLSFDLYLLFLVATCGGQEV